jgi:uncharacterized protein YvpB
MIGIILDYEYAVLIFFGLFLALFLVNLKLILKLIEKTFRSRKELFHKGFFGKFRNWFIRKIIQTKQDIVSTIQRKTSILKKVLRLSKYTFPFFTNIFIFISMGVILYHLFGFTPGVQSSYPTDNYGLESYEKPICIIFDRPINESLIKPYIFPEIKGEWKVESVYSFMPFIKRKVVFYPEESMFEGKVLIYYAGIRDIFGSGEDWEYGINSSAVKLPSDVVANTDNNSTDFAVDGNLEFYMDAPYGNQVAFDFSILPAIPFKVDKVGVDKLIVDFDGTLAQSTEYSYQLFKIPQRYNIKTQDILESGTKEILKEGKFVTIKEPLIKSIEPNGGEVLIDSQIKIVFDQAMPEDVVKANFSINPAVEGVIEKVDDTTYIFKGNNFSKNTKYEVKLAKGMRSTKGGLFEKDFFHSFTTIGYVRVVGFAPGNNVNNVKRATNINVTFNQAVDHATAQAKFSISPSIEGSFSWSGNTMIFNPSEDLGYESAYSVSVGAGVKTVSGIDSNENFSSRFSTEIKQFILNVPVYPQTARFSCQMYAAAMAIAYKTGGYVNAMNLYNNVAKDNTAPTCDPSTKAIVTWGNPYNGYVGNIYGTAIAGCNRSGYGVYWGPMSNVISAYRPNQVISGWSTGDMLKEVEAGNPVVVWAHNGYSGSGQNFYWTTPGGQSIRAVTGMHSYVVVGFIGNAESSRNVILNDPARGRRWTVTTSYFNALWSYFGNTGIIVR